MDKENGATIGAPSQTGQTSSELQSPAQIMKEGFGAMSGDLAHAINKAFSSLKADLEVWETQTTRLPSPLRRSKQTRTRHRMSALDWTSCSINRAQQKMPLMRAKVRYEIP